MGPIKLDSRITGQMKVWGGNFNSMEGCDHDSGEDKVDEKIDGQAVTLNTMSKMDSPHPKTDAENPGFDKAFWAKAEPPMDTTGHGKLTRALQDDNKHDKM